VAEPPLVLTVEETAAALRIGRTAAYEAARRGEIPTVKVGRRLLVPRAKLEAMLGLEKGEAPATTPGLGEESGGQSRHGAA
jgi:excisionase family DNA binding protein